MTDYGPYANWAQVNGAEHVQAAHATARKAAHPVGSHETPNLAMLMDACAGTGVEVGAYDSRILRWLSGWEAETVAVVAGLIVRAAGGEG